MASLGSMDKEFLKERSTKKRKKAQNFLQGIGQGFDSLTKGFSDGFSGVIMQPLNGAKTEGAKGVFKGLGKGLVGLVTKPLSGVLDSVSKAAEVRSSNLRKGHTESDSSRIKRQDDSMQTAESILRYRRKTEGIRRRRCDVLQFDKECEP